MSFPAPAAHGQGQVKESGGQPLVYGAIPVNSLVARSSGASTHVLRGVTLGTNLTFAGDVLNAAGGGGLADGDYGDVTVSGVGTVMTIDNDVVTYAKMQNVSAASRLIGRGSAAGAGDPEEITLGANLSMAGTVLSAAGAAVAITAATITVAYGTRDALVAIVDAAVGAATKIMQVAGAYLQTDTNDPSDISVSIADVGVGTFNVRVSAIGRESIGGPFKLFYVLG
jgi:hypothetical protein